MGVATYDNIRLQEIKSQLPSEEAIQKRLEQAEEEYILKLKEKKKLPPNACIIGIDACLGDINSIGEIHTRDYPIHPGKGVGKSLPDVGVASIIGIIDSSDAAEFFTSRSIRLHLVFEMAKVISNGLINAYYLNSLSNKQC